MTAPTTTAGTHDQQMLQRLDREGHTLEQELPYRGAARHAGYSHHWPVVDHAVRVEVLVGRKHIVQSSSGHAGTVHSSKHQRPGGSARPRSLHRLGITATVIMTRMAWAPTSGVHSQDDEKYLQWTQVGPRWESNGHDEDADCRIQTVYRLRVGLGGYSRQRRRLGASGCLTKGGRHVGKR